jgi:chromosome segregation ATPase
MLTDEVNQRAKPPESPFGDENSSEVEELGDEVMSPERVTEVERLVAQKDEELALANARIAELEEALADKDGDIAALEQLKTELEEELSTLNGSLAEAVANYKTMVIQTNPEVMEELISGDNIEAINESLEKARSLISWVRQGLETEISLARVPTGAPERRSPDLSALSPSEKIQYAIGGRR